MKSLISSYAVENSVSGNEEGSTLAKIPGKRVLSLAKKHTGAKGEGNDGRCTFSMAVSCFCVVL